MNVSDDALVKADPTRRPQVIWNLLTIAVKLTEPHGRIDADVRAPPGR